VTVSWIMFALCLLTIGVAVVAWALWCAEPVGPASEDPAGEACPLCRPRPIVSPWLPLDTDPRGDDVLVEPPGWARRERLVDLPGDLEPRSPPSVASRTIKEVERYLQGRVS
jgi:hypothetical protein